MGTVNIVSINFISLNWSHVFLCICIYMLIYLICMHTHNPYVYINIAMKICSFMDVNMCICYMHQL